MDGTLVDFVSQINKYDYWRKNKPNKVDWDKVIAEGPNFWAEMNWMPGAKESFEKLQDYAAQGMFELYILSSIDFDEGREGKKLWIQKKTTLPLENAIFVLEPEYKEQFADKDSARAILPLAELLLEQGDTVNARMYAEKAFTGELKLDTAEAKRIIVAIQEYVESEKLAKQETAKKDSLEQVRKDSLLKVEAQQTNQQSQVEQEKVKEKQRQEEQRKKEEAQKKEEEKRQKEAAQKVADQAYAAKMALQYVNGSRTYENHSKAYEWALKADDKTKAQVIEKLKQMDFPIP